MTAADSRSVIEMISTGLRIRSDTPVGLSGLIAGATIP
ncbi:hypothetical protein BZL30_5265 [Mycobacterium kansasii]|uniref:Uncharacterized protein n=1 Tax=Mycobacterium kansasii TaxID=1768 RepID=A0A1V3WZ63_MYCKA|nr:hypothetical protein BZL30_5265 [Mycobacterium kansasii]